jgi:hypothetical protein
MHRPIVRPLAVILFCALVVTSSVRLQAHAMSEFCYWWDAGLAEPDDLWCFDASGVYTWGWNGGYDISNTPEEDRLMLAADICDDLTYSCWDTCESQAFRSVRAGFYSDQTGGQCTYTWECVMSWGNASCQQGSSGGFSCSCGSVNTCAPC